MKARLTVTARHSLDVVARALPVSLASEIASPALHPALALRPLNEHRAPDPSRPHRCRCRWLWAQRFLARAAHFEPRRLSPFDGLTLANGGGAAFMASRLALRAARKRFRVASSIKRFALALWPRRARTATTGMAGASRSG